ncbi:copper fist DNA binding domain-containing protein [Aspergillus aurantiobrunneus]
MPLDEKGNKWSCEPCLRGHRSSKCKHYDRLMVKVAGSGRPLKGCPHSKLHCGCRKSYAVMAPVLDDSPFLCRPLHSFTGNPDELESGSLDSLMGSVQMTNFTMEHCDPARTLGNSPLAIAPETQSRDAWMNAPANTDNPERFEYQSSVNSPEPATWTPIMDGTISLALSEGEGNVPRANGLHDTESGSRCFPSVSLNGWSDSSTLPMTFEGHFNRVAHISIPTQSTVPSGATHVFHGTFPN